MSTAINRRDHGWKEYREKPTTINLQKYHTLRNLATHEKRQAKEKYEMNLALKIKDDKRIFFSYVKSKTKLKPEIGAIRGDDGKLSKDNEEAARIMNLAFQNVFVKGDDTRTKVDTTNNYTADDEQITEEEIREVIAKLKEGKAFGPDGISNEILKRCEKELLVPICIIFNKSIKESTIPDLWRCANVTPIFKKGTKEDPLNYRPVSLTCVLSKILETIIKNRMMIDLEEGKILIEEQHGFRSERSTTSNLIEFYNEVTKDIDNKHAVDILFFDLSKAFDTVPHTKLIEKLRMLKLNVKIVDWIEDYLTGRKQRVIVRGGASEWLDVFSGVPQGSVIGPILFLLYINDIKDGIESRLSIFADDTKMMHVVDTEEDRLVLTKDLERLEKWSQVNKMKFNIDKCSVMHCGYGNQNAKYNLYGSELRATETEKDLGVLIDRDMKFSSQVMSQTKKANKVLGMIKRNFQTINKDLFQILYSTLVRPHLEYAVQVWSPYQVGHKKKIEQIQRRATKMIREIRNIPYEERLDHLDLMSTEHRRNRGDMITTFKIMNNKVKLRPGTLTKAKESGTRGHDMKIYKPNVRTEMRKNFFTNRVVNKWNDLGRNVIESKSIEQFKKAYDHNNDGKKRMQHNEDLLKAAQTMK